MRDAISTKHNKTTWRSIFNEDRCRLLIIDKYLLHICKKRTNNVSVKKMGKGLEEIIYTGANPNDQQICEEILRCSSYERSKN